ncbi:hypothetical protein HHK36_006349 [Tetracentron sinense]|uniref:Uncharacterized protein n=1 Tax=Tetracentron sinense TaxID=13715 RepID=A0A835DP20_TETSI|nr:hypothetical protein HHK36_006349 [Tetracentron sinense]
MSQGEVSKWVVDNVEAMGRELGVSTEGRQVDVRCLYSRLEERKEQEQDEVTLMDGDMGCDIYPLGTCM